jgi:hypothetical protein
MHDTKLNISGYSDSKNLGECSILSSWMDESSIETNRISYAQLKLNLNNLDYIFTELKCQYRCLMDSAEIKEEYTLLVSNSNLYDIILLGAKYKQRAIIHKDGAAINIMDTVVGRILSSYKNDSTNMNFWLSIYAKFLGCKYDLHGEVKIVSLEKLHIPTRTESLLEIKSKEGLAATRWVSIYNI